MLKNAYFLQRSVPIQPKASNILPKFCRSDVGVLVGAAPLPPAPDTDEEEDLCEAGLSRGRARKKFGGSREVWQTSWTIAEENKIDSTGWRRRWRHPVGVLGVTLTTHYSKYEVFSNVKDELRSPFRIVFFPQVVWLLVNFQECAVTVRLKLPWFWGRMPAGRRQAKTSISVDF